MGDMKTPDFDDLLAAFDIPDIDAKEAIQSARDEAEGHHGSGSGTLGKPGDDGADGSHAMRPTSPPGSDSHGDPPIVSVIVKNRVRTETLDGGEGTVSEREPADGTPGIGLVPRLGTRSPGLAPPESLNHNGFVSSSASGHLPQSQGQSNGDSWPLCAPKATPDSAEFLSGSASSSKQGGGNIFNKLKPLMAQGSGDPIGRARKMQLLQQQKHLHMQQQQQQQQQQQEAPALEAKPSKAPAAATAAAAAAASSGTLASSPFFPPSKAMHLPSSASSASSSSSSSSSSSHANNPRVSGPLGSSSAPLQSFNGTSRSGQTGFRRLDSDEEDSDPDLGAPLVIQESPGSPACSAPKMARRVRSPAGSFESPSLPSSGSSSSFPKPGDVPSASPASPQGQQNWLSSPSSSQTSATSKSSPQEERHPEHVVEERDSPESPEPEAPKPASASSSSAPKRSSSPAAASTAATTKTPSPALREPKEEEEEMEVAKGVVEKTEERKEQESKGTEEEKMDVQEEGEKVEGKAQSAEGGAAPPVAVGTATPAGSAPSRPLKVRIKTIKTPTGSITRTVVASSKGGGAGKGLEVIKAQQGNAVPANRARRTNAAVARVAKSSASLPVSTLEASSAMLAAATKVQSKMASPSDKGKLTATAVSITKTAALPATSVVSGISVRPVAKATNGGTAAAGGGGGGGGGVHQPCKPASIVNSTGAVISRSQSSLVEAFNKILNSKNLLPSYKPDLSAPPPPEWGLGMPAAGYRCLECGDSFALERSLVRHYDRRSLRIEVTCNHCAKRLAFFNKCSLLLHAREHKERGLVMQCSHLVMRPVSVEQMISQQDNAPIGMLSPSPSLSSAPAAPQVTPSVSTVTPSPQKDSPSPSATAPQPAAPRRLPSSPQAIMPLPCKKVDVLQYNNFKCPECQAQFAGKAELVAHFQQIRATPNSTCMLCSPPMMLPNWCSVAAHQRIHKHRAPHVCPECGGVARQASFQTHLEESCLHFARRIGYRCSICQVVFGGLNSIKSHIQTAHCEVFHKCPNCPMAFKSAPSAQSHISTQHPTLTTTQPKMIYKCVMCDTVFTQKPLLYVHFDTHLAKQKVHVFKCPDCTKLYAQKASMMEHMKTVHRGLSVKPETPPTTTTTTTSTPGTTSLTVPLIPKARGQEGEEWSGEPGEEEGDREGEGGEKEEEEEDEEENEEEDEPESSPESSSLEWKCRECRTRYSEKEDYISHMRKEHGKPMKKFPCRMCERSFSSANSLRRHVRVIHEGIRRVFHCQYCSEGKRTFSSRLILEKHIRVRHGIRSRQPVDRQGPPNTRKRSAPAEGVGSSSEQEGDGGFEEGAEGPGGGGGGGAVKRWRPTATSAGEASSTTPQDRDEPRQEGEESGSGEGEENAGAATTTPASGTNTTTTTTPAAPAGYKCTPCGFATEDWAEFQRHIPQHQAEGGVGGAGSLQCTQCGACFASAGSLARHRFITHRLRNEVRGRGKNAAGAAGASGASPDDNGGGGGGGGAATPDDGSPTSPLRGEDGSYGCRVCGRRFDKQPDLNTHFRTHGMAFITAHKNDKPT